MPDRGGPPGCHHAGQRQRVENILEVRRILGQGVTVSRLVALSVAAQVDHEETEVRSESPRQSLPDPPVHANAVNEEQWRLLCVDHRAMNPQIAGRNEAMIDGWKRRG